MQKKTIWDMNRPNVEEYRRREKIPVVVVLDNIRSLNNIGSIFRTSDAFGIRGLCLCGITATPPSVEIHKTALGAEDSVDWQYYDTTLGAVEHLRSQGYTIICLEQVRGSVSPRNLPLDRGGRYAIICGNEVEGVDQAVVDASDICLEIPQVGTKHSLNVSVSTGLAIWTLFEFFTEL